MPALVEICPAQPMPALILVPPNSAPDVHLPARSQMSVKFSWFMPALVEKTRLLLAVGDWEQHMEHVALVLKADAQNPSALAWTGRSGDTLLPTSQSLCLSFCTHIN